MKTNSEYKSAARAALKGNWAPAVLVTVVYFVIVLCIILPAEMPLLKGGANSAELAAMLENGDMEGVISYYKEVTAWSSLSSLLRIFLLNVLEVGFVVSFLKLLREGDARLTSNMFRVGFRKYWHKVWTVFLYYFFILLWTLLLIIPGLIKVFSYAMTPYILEDNPELSATETINRSRAMMKGHKFDLFWLYLGFIGWFLLSLLTLGIGLIWLIPYAQTAVADFYEDVKADYQLNGGLV